MKRGGRENSKQSLKEAIQVGMSTVVVTVVGSPTKVLCLTPGEKDACSPQDLLLFSEGQLGTGLGVTG